MSGGSHGWRDTQIHVVDRRTLLLLGVPSQLDVDTKSLFTSFLVNGGVNVNRYKKKKTGRNLYKELISGQSSRRFEIV